MKAVLFITDKYSPLPSSNGACVSNIVQYLRSLQYTVVVLSVYDRIAGKGNFGEITYSVQSRPENVSYYNRLFRYMEDQKLVDLLYSAASELCDKYKIDTVVSVYRPIEAVLCGQRLNMERGLTHIPCFFDIPETADLMPLKKKIIQFNYARLYNRLATHGKIGVLKYYAEKFRSEIHTSHNDCVIPIGIPNLHDRTKEITPKEQDPGIHLVYAGSFYDKIRNPEPVLKFMQCILGEEIVLHFYSWGCEDILKPFKARFGNQLLLHDRVDLQQIQKIMTECDMLVNISNDTPFQVPGKIVEYFSTGKPILNFCYRLDDAGRDDYSKYPLLYDVKLFEKNNSEECVSFIKGNKNNRVEFSQIESLFYECTPAYFVKSLLN